MLNSLAPPSIPVFAIFHLFVLFLVLVVERKWKIEEEDENEDENEADAIAHSSQQTWAGDRLPILRALKLRHLLSFYLKLFLPAGVSSLRMMDA